MRRRDGRYGIDQRLLDLDLQRWHRGLHHLVHSPRIDPEPAGRRPLRGPAPGLLAARTPNKSNVHPSQTQDLAQPITGEEQEPDCCHRMGRELREPLVLFGRMLGARFPRIDVSGQSGVSPSQAVSPGAYSLVSAMMLGMAPPDAIRCS